MARPIRAVVFGTAGHIDHGKSSLIRALTGIDPDRLKEEKERGLTIDLGFARMRLPDGRWIGFVDVPGHERFVHNMVAGATGIDLALLVVAADDGVMPQTVEHVEILDLLRVRGGLIALTKVDAVDPALAAVAAEEVQQLVRGTVLADAAIVRASARTGEGLDELRQAIERLALAVEPRPHSGPFRMPIQRVFTLAGIGTVVTGIPVSGSIRAGAEIEVLPPGAALRVRAVHAYGGEVEEAVAGHSTALAVPDARELDVRRGMVCAEPGRFASGDAIDVELTTTKRAPAIDHRQPVRCHLGTAETMGRLLLLDRDEAGAGQCFVARIELDEAVVAAPGDRFLLRLQTPAATVGGGRVLRLERSGRYHRRRLGAELAAVVAAGDRPAARLLQELSSAGPAGCVVDDLARALGLEEGAVVALCDELPDVVLHARPMRAFLAAHVAAGESELAAAVGRLLEKRPEAASIKRTAVRATRTLPQPLIDCLFDRLVAAGQVRSGRQGQMLFLARLQPLPAAIQRQLDDLVAYCTARGMRPPDLAELGAELGVTGEALLSLVDRAQDEQRVELVGGHVYAAATIRSVLHAVRDNCLQHGGELLIPALRDRLDTSRKYLIPLLEHVDALGLTVLRGGVRRLLPSSPVARELAGESG